MREKTPLFFDERNRTWYVLSYKLISQILSEKENKTRVIPDQLGFLRLSLPSLSGLEHKNTRSYYFEKINVLLSHDFTQGFRDSAQRNLDALRSNWFTELNQDLVTPYVIDCICLVYGEGEMLGIISFSCSSLDLETKKMMILDALDERVCCIRFVLQ